MNENDNSKFLKTKIIVTFGPNINNVEKITNLIKKDVNIFRINTSHENISYYKKVVKLIREVSQNLNKKVLIMFDLKGPEIRIIDVNSGLLSVKKDYKIKIFYNNDKYNELKDKESLLINYDDFGSLIDVDDFLYINDAKLKVKILKITDEDKYLLVKAENDGHIKNRKKINTLNNNIKLKFLGKEDQETLKLAIDEKIEVLALSFVRDKEDINIIKNFLLQNSTKYEPMIMSKIENKQAIDNLDNIVKYSDSIMVARGDLAIQTDFSKLGFYEKKIVFKTQKYNKPVFVATQLLDSMTKNLFPNRSEIIDIYFAIILGTDGLVLTQETAIGDYPLLVVDTMIKISQEAETDFNFESYFLLAKKNNESKYYQKVLKILNYAKRKELKELFVFSNNINFIQEIARYHSEFKIFIFFNNSEINQNYLFFKFGIIPIFTTDLNLNNLREVKNNFEKYKKFIFQLINNQHINKFMIINENNYFII